MAMETRIRRGVSFEAAPDPFEQALARVELHERVSARVQVVATLQLVLGGLGLMAGGFVAALIAGAGLLTQDPVAGAWLGSLGALAGGLLAVLSAPALFAGFGLLRRRPWARVLALVLGTLELFHVPLGTVIGGYTLYVLLQDATRLHFDEGSS
jgi:hypothetical protein